MTFAIIALLGVVSLLQPAAAASSTHSLSDDLYHGWMQMYNLKFDEAHRIFGRWIQNHPADPLGPVSDAAAYLFSELARLGALESELFIEDKRFVNRKKLRPDPETKARFNERIAQADHLADLSLQKSDTDPDALFAKTLTFGLRADYTGLVDKQSLTALHYTKEARPYAEKLLSVDSHAYDAYLGPGMENYLFSLKAAPVRILLQLTGSKVDREKGLEQLRMTALHGHYLEPFAKLLLAVAALRDKNPERAHELLKELHDRFPANELFSRELEKLPARAR